MCLKAAGVILILVKHAAATVVSSHVRLISIGGYAKCSVESGPTLSSLLSRIPRGRRWIMSVHVVENWLRWGVPLISNHWWDLRKAIWQKMSASAIKLWVEAIIARTQLWL